MLAVSVAVPPVQKLAEPVVMVTDALGVGFWVATTVLLVLVVPATVTLQA